MSKTGNRNCSFVGQPKPRLVAGSSKLKPKQYIHVNLFTVCITPRCVSVKRTRNEDFFQAVFSPFRAKHSILCFDHACMLRGVSANGRRVSILIDSGSGNSGYVGGKGVVLFGITSASGILSHNQQLNARLQTRKLFKYMNIFTCNLNFNSTTRVIQIGLDSQIDTPPIFFNAHETMVSSRG